MSELREGLAKAPFLNALRNQRQLDEDGVEVGVSRQAVDEAIEWIIHAHDGHAEFVRQVRANLWFSAAMVETDKLDDAIAWIRQAIELCDAELAKEISK